MLYKKCVKLSIAPMMEITDRHFRYLMRVMSKRTLLYTPMITMYALIHGDVKTLLHYSPEEHPLALQLGGSDPEKLAHCAKLAEEFGYDEVNLNVGCPSDRVQEGCFGAYLMAKPELVAECVAAMKAKVKIPVTVKHRIGINGKETYEDMVYFVSQVAKAKCDCFIVHARIAVLEGLNPKQNRTIPPLRYEDVYRLKKDFPSETIVINGGIRTLEDAQTQLRHVDGVMIGRAAEDNSILFTEADQKIFAEPTAPLTREEIIERYIPYFDAELAKGTRPRELTRHLMPLFNGFPGARFWRRRMGDPGTTSLKTHFLEHAKQVQLIAEKTLERT